METLFDKIICFQVKKKKVKYMCSDFYKNLMTVTSTKEMEDNLFRRFYIST